MNKIKSTRFAIFILTTVVIKSSIVWDITLCSPLKVNWCFGGTCRFHLQGKINQARHQHDVGQKQDSVGFLLGLLFTLMIEATCSSEMFVGCQWTTWHYIPEDRTLRICKRPEMKNQRGFHYYCILEVDVCMYVHSDLERDCRNALCCAKMCMN
jgi:hypothetical protein